MPSDYLRRLPYCLRCYIDDKRWTGFYEVQEKSFDVLFESDEHLIISAGTSSGKTEAALFPVITEIFNDRPKRISALYISPLIALIDDQKDRVSKMLKDSGICIYSWHGDVSSSLKNKIMENGEGILQITPESLERIVYKNFEKVPEMFTDLRFVVIDEIHTFMNSDRGLQLLCELEMIEHLAHVNPRRIGLSATLSDYDVAKSWIKGNTTRDVAVVECTDKPRYSLEIGFMRFPKKDSPERERAEKLYYLNLFEKTNAYNCIVFANDRTGVENVTRGLKDANASKGVQKNIMAHHSSISKEFRKLAEERMKDESVKCTAVATSTLELGIDIGDLDRVVHINAPQSVSSFIQKFGRSGRRNGNPVMVCICDNTRATRLADIDMDLIKAIAETQLYFNDHWIEPVRYSSLPYSLLFQQTMSYVRSRITASKTELVRDVLSLYPFRNITEADFKKLLDYLVECQVLEYNTYHKTYVLDAQGERLSKELDFGSNFFTQREFDVFSGKDRIGSIQYNPSPGNIIQLAGMSWQVTGFDSKYQRILVKRSTKFSETYWKSGKADVSTRLMRQMYKCLLSHEKYQYLDESAAAALDSSRNSFRAMGLDGLIVSDGRAVRLYPWLGTVQFDTLYRVLVHSGLATFCEPPYAIGLKERVSMDDVVVTVYKFKEYCDPIELVDEDDVMSSQVLGKYNRYIPVELLKQQFVRDRIDLKLVDNFLLGRHDFELR